MSGHFLMTVEEILLIRCFDIDADAALCHDIRLLPPGCSWLRFTRISKNAFFGAESLDRIDRYSFSESGNTTSFRVDAWRRPRSVIAILALGRFLTWLDESHIPRRGRRVDGKHIIFTGNWMTVSFTRARHILSNRLGTRRKARKHQFPVR
jgi:hypothetical protein